MLASTATATAQMGARLVIHGIAVSQFDSGVDGDNADQFLLVHYQKVRLDNPENDPFGVDLSAFGHSPWGIIHGTNTEEKYNLFFTVDVLYVGARCRRWSCSIVRKGSVKTISSHSC
jgi:hypothetical protein